MIQILEIRSYVDKGIRKQYRKPVGVDAPSVKDLFANIDYYLSKIPKKERFNLHYSLAHWEDATGKEFGYQDIFPIDLDGIDTTKLDEYIAIVCTVLEVDPSDIGIVASGNGLHFLIGMSEPITDSSFFESTRHYYKAFCGRIASACFHAGLPCDVDAMSWQTGKSLRLPKTLNIKDDKGTKECTLINGKIDTFKVDIVELSKLPQVELDEQISKDMAAKMPIDTKGVLSCPFLQYCRANPAEVSEPQWYASLSLIGRLENGHQLAHEFSEGHPSYNKDETDMKIEQATECSGPRTCGNISTLWSGCAVCELQKTITSPIQITTKEFIKTESSGFHDIIIKNNVQVKGKPNYSDLCKYFKRFHSYCTIDESKTVMVYNNGLWERYSQNKIYKFAEDNFNPSPDNRMCAEFAGKLQRTSIKDISFFNTIGKVNFLNGWQDMEAMDSVLNPHSEALGFLYKLPFKYDPNATCPRFEKFIREITMNDAEVMTVLYEFMGYTFSGADPDIGGKALIMVGDGSNGKSVLVEVIKAVVGVGNYSVTNLKDAVTKPESRANMQGKLLNISEETPNKALADSSTFKNLVTGGEVESRRLYDNSISMKNIAKLIMTCNEMPTSSDLSYGLRRRLLLIPFMATFTDTLGNRDPFLKDKLLKELPGIFNLTYKYYDEMRKRGHFTTSKAVKDKIQQYLEEGSEVVEWLSINDTYHLTRDAAHITSCNDLYLAYQRSCVSLDQRPLDIRVFGKEITKLGIKKARRVEDGERKYVYIGIKQTVRGADEAGDGGSQTADF